MLGDEGRGNGDNDKRIWGKQRGVISRIRGQNKAKLGVLWWRKRLVKNEAVGGKRKERELPSVVISSPKTMPALANAVPEAYRGLTLPVMPINWST